jgi:hypothetical protein
MSGPELPPDASKLALSGISGRYGYTRRLMRLRSTMALVGTVALGGVILVAPAASGATAKVTALVSKSINVSALANSVTVTGVAIQGKSTITLSLQASSSAAGQGSIEIGGGIVHAIRLGKNVYFTANQKFWKANGGSAAAELFAGKWVQTAATSTIGRPLAAFLNVGTLFRELFSTNINTANFVKGKSTTVNGVRVISINNKSTTGKTTGTVYIASSGKPYLVELKSTSGDLGSISFSAYNQPVRPVAPKNPIDIDKLNTGTSG